MPFFQNEEVLTYYPLRISFVGKLAVDCGCVCRDMLSGFWEEAYQLHFDGSSLLTPVLHAQLNMSTFSVIGTILSHGYLQEDFLPHRIAFPSLASMLLGQVEIPDIFVSSFVDSLSSVESNLLKANHSAQSLWLQTITNTVQLASTSCPDGQV